MVTVPRRDCQILHDFQPGSPAPRNWPESAHHVIFLQARWRQAGLAQGGKATRVRQFCPISLAAVFKTPSAFPWW